MPSAVGLPALPVYVLRTQRTDAMADADGENICIDWPPDSHERYIRLLGEIARRSKDAITRLERVDDPQRQYGEATEEAFDAWTELVDFIDEQGAIYARPVRSNDPSPDARAMALLEEIHRLSDQLRTFLDPPQKKGDRRASLPTSLAQQTFQELRALAIAISDGPSLRRWEQVDGEIAMRHVVPGQPHQTRFSAGAALLKWWAAPPNYDLLSGELTNAGLPAVLLANVAVGLALRDRQAEVSLDDLSRMIGLIPRSSVERLEMRRKVWRWLMLLDSLPVIGKRAGRYKDPRTKQQIELTSIDAFIRITGTRIPAQSVAEAGEPPAPGSSNTAVTAKFSRTLATC
jgi:hypothetical protein